MEVTTVSPSPASPTEGDDLCETDVINVAIHSVTLLICLVGLAGNGALLRLLSLDDRNSTIFHLAVIDFLFLLFTVPSAFLFLVEDVSCSPIVPLKYVSFVFQLSGVSYFWGLYELSKDVVGVYDYCEIYCCCELPERLWWVVYGVQYWAFFALFTAMPTLTSLCPSQEQEHCRAALISMCTIILLLFAAPVLITRAITITKAMCRNKQRPKSRHIVTFIIVLLSLILGLCNFLQQLSYIPVSSEVVLLLNCIHSSIKPFVYFFAGSFWRLSSGGPLRLSLQSVFEEKKANTAGSDDANTDTVL